MDFFDISLGPEQHNVLPSDIYGFVPLLCEIKCIA